MEGNVITTQEVFRFRQRTVDATGAVKGSFESTGVRPNFTTRLQAHGIEIPGNILSFREEV
jgi:pilus assembly protein CpaF